MDTRFLIFMKPRLRVAALARPLGAKNGQGCATKVRRTRNTINITFSSPQPHPPVTSKYSSRRSSAGTSPTGAITSNLLQLWR